MRMIRAAALISTIPLVLGSCSGHCGETSPAGCGCDSQCADYGDCCSDYIEQCKPRLSTRSSCVGRCGETSAPEDSVCFCDDSCGRHGDCCQDYQRACPTAGSRANTPTASTSSAPIDVPKSMQTCENRCLVNDRDPKDWSSSTASSRSSIDPLLMASMMGGGMGNMGNMNPLVLNSIVNPTSSSSSRVDPMTLMMMSGGMGGGMGGNMNNMNPFVMQSLLGGETSTIDPMTMMMMSGGMGGGMGGGINNMNPFVMQSLLGGETSTIDPMTMMMMSGGMGGGMGGNMNNMNPFVMQSLLGGETSTIDPMTMMMMSGGMGGGNMGGGNMNPFLYASVLGADRQPVEVDPLLLMMSQQGPVQGPQGGFNQGPPGRFHQVNTYGPVRQPVHHASHGNQNNGFMQQYATMQMLQGSSSSNYDPLTMAMMMGGNGRGSSGYDPLMMAMLMGEDQAEDEDIVNTLLLTQAFQRAASPSNGFRALDGDASSEEEEDDSPPPMEFFGSNSQFTAGIEEEEVEEQESDSEETGFVPPAGFMSAVSENGDDRVFVNHNTNNNNAPAPTPQSVAPRTAAYSTSYVSTTAPVHYAPIQHGYRSNIATPVNNDMQMMMDYMLLKSLGGSSSSSSSKRNNGVACFCDSQCDTMGDCCADFTEFCSSSSSRSNAGGSSSNGGMNTFAVNALMGDPLGMGAQDPLSLMALGVDPLTSMLVTPQLGPAESCGGRCGSLAVISPASVLQSCGCTSACRQGGVCCSDFFLSCPFN